MANNTIKTERYYSHSLQKVWEAISKAEEISAWFIKADFKAETGYQYTFTHENTVISGKVLEVDPPKKLIYTWIVSGTEVETTVTWELEEKEGGTLLKLEHTGIEGYGPAAETFFNNFKGGWENCFNELEKYLK